MTQSSNDAQPVIDRRAALRRVTLFLGGALSASTVAGVLAGCEARRTPDGAWTPRALTSEQVELVAAVAEHILPETDTPGARAALVHRFIDAMLAESYPAEERQRVMTGLGDLDAPAQRSCRPAFLRRAPPEPRAGLDEPAPTAVAAACAAAARPRVFRT